MTELVAAPPAYRPPSPALAEAMRQVLAARPAGSPPLVLTDATRSEAARRLAGTRMALDARAEPGTIAAWVERIIALIGHPSAADEIEVKVAALSDALRDLPRRCFTAASADAVAVAAGRFFPDLASIRATISPEADDLRREARALSALIERPREPERVVEAVTPDQAEANRRMARQLLAEAQAREMGTRVAPAKAMHASPAELVEHYRAVVARGGPMADAAAARLRTLGYQGESAA